MINKVKMVLNQQTRAGLTFGQVLSVLAIIGGLITVWVSLNVKIAQAELRIEQLEKSRIESASRNETSRKENREEHQRIMEKLDRLIERERLN